MALALVPSVIKDISTRITITNDALKTFFTGAMGSVTFGTYSQYQNMETIKLNNQNQAEIMRLNNEVQEKKTLLLIDEMKKEIIKESTKSWIFR
jgi:hypothetical protein